MLNRAVRHARNIVLESLLSRTGLAVIGKLAVTALLIALVWQGVELDAVRARLDRLSPGLLAGAAGLVALQVLVVVTWRWSKIIAVMERPAPPAQLLRIVIIAMFFNQVLPSTVGGDGMRIWLLHRLGWGIGVSARSVILDRLLGLTALTVLSLLGSLYLLVRMPGSAPVWAVATVSTCGIAAIVGAPLLLRLFRRLPFEPVRRNLEVVATEMGQLWRDKGLMGRLFAISLLGHLMMSAAIWLIARSLGVDLGIVDGLAVLPAVILVSSLPISIAGWGVREGGMVVGLGLLAIGGSDAALVSIFFGLLLLGCGLLGGAVWLVTRAPRPAAEDKAPYSPPMP
jgi:uncharacterized membrane protein YbhN (UPF0104 family)